MPFVIRKLRGEPFYSVKNKVTGEIHSKGTTLDKAKAQMRLLYAVDNGWTPTGSGLSDFSNPKEVQRLADKYDVGKVYSSTRKDKKYMVQDPSSGRWVHFGQMGYADFTHHKDEERRKRFLQRNKKWKNTEKYSPSWLAYHLLW